MVHGREADSKREVRNELMLMQMVILLPRARCLGLGSCQGL